MGKERGRIIIIKKLINARVEKAFDGHAINNLKGIGQSDQRVKADNIGIV